MLRKPMVKTIMISPVPASVAAASSRPISVKRIGRLRINWFVVGAVFGIGASFFMNFVVTVIVLPGYARLTAPAGVVQVSDAGADKKDAPAAASLAAAIQPLPPAASPQPPSYPRTVALQVGKGDTLLDMLIANQVQETEAHNVIKALKAKLNPGSLRVGQKISVTLARHEQLGDKAAVKELAIHLPNFSLVELERKTNGQFNVASVKEELKESAYRGAGVVKSSLFQAGADGGIPSATMQEIVKAFSYDVDFQRDIHPGDKVEVLMSRKTAKDGRVGGYGELRYAALTLRGKKKEIFRFKDGYGEFAWFDSKGNSIKKSLLRTPLDAARITSGFGMRTHPIMGYTKFHRGVDFGASTGTPILAAGDGVVAFKGWKNGYGNFVVLKHNGTYETAYGHCSRFGNIQVGGRVKQGQVIAYVGMTGMATGPHLHYEVLQNDTQVNPVAKQFNMASGLTGKQLAAFKANKTAIVGQLAALSKPAAQLASR